MAVEEQITQQVRVVRAANRAGTDAARTLNAVWPEVRRLILDYAERVEGASPPERESLIERFGFELSAILLVAYGSVRGLLEQNATRVAGIEHEFQSRFLTDIPSPEGSRAAARESLTDGQSRPRAVARARQSYLARMARIVGAGLGAVVALRDAREGHRTELRNVSTLAHSDLVGSVSSVREFIFEDSEDVRGEVWSSVLDNRTTPLCRANAGATRAKGQQAWRRTNGSRYIGPGPGAAHWGCRSQSVPWYVDERRPQVPTFRQYLLSQPASVQREVLGARRYELWKAGEPLGSFVNERGRQLTLDELARRSKAA